MQTLQLRIYKFLCRQYCQYFTVAFFVKYASRSRTLNDHAVESMYINFQICLCFRITRQ